MLPPNGSSPYNRGGSLLHHGQERGRSRRDWSSGRLVRLPFGLSPSSALDLPRLGVNYMSRPHTYSVCPARWRRSWAYCTPKRWKWCMSACAATPPPIPCASSRKVAYVKLYSGCEIRLMSCSMRLGSIVRKGPEPFSNREVAVLSIVGTVVSVGVWVGLVFSDGSVLVRLLMSIAAASVQVRLLVIAIWRRQHRSWTPRVRDRSELRKQSKC